MVPSEGLKKGRDVEGGGRRTAAVVPPFAAPACTGRTCSAAAGPTVQAELQSWPDANRRRFRDSIRTTDAVSKVRPRTTTNRKYHHQPPLPCDSRLNSDCSKKFQVRRPNALLLSNQKYLKRGSWWSFLVHWRGGRKVPAFQPRAVQKNGCFL